MNTKIKHDKTIYILTNEEGFINTFTVNPLAGLMAWVNEQNAGNELTILKQIGQQIPAPIEIEELFKEIPKEDQADLMQRIAPFRTTIN